MSVKQLSIGRVRERFPRLLQQAIDQAAKLPIQRPGWPVGGVQRMHWVSWRTVAAAVLLGGIVHICATFVAPFYTGGHAFARLSERLPVNSMVVLPPLAPGDEVLPYLPGNTRYAMCRYDLRDGPVSVTAKVLGPGWSLSLHAPDGSNFYVLPGQAARHVDVSFLVVPSTPELVLTMARYDGDETQIASPSLEGIAVLRAPSRGVAWAAEAEAVLEDAACARAEKR